MSGAVSGRALGGALAILLALGWIGQTVRAERRIAASRLLGARRRSRFAIRMSSRPTRGGSATTVSSFAHRGV